MDYFNNYDENDIEDFEEYLNYYGLDDFEDNDDLAVYDDSIDDDTDIKELFF